jgi:hypothetical protein
MFAQPIFLDNRQRIGRYFINVFISKSGKHQPFNYVEKASADVLLPWLRLSDDKGAYRINVKPKAGE